MTRYPCIELSCSKGKTIGDFRIGERNKSQVKEKLVVVSNRDESAKHVVNCTKTVQTSFPCQSTLVSFISFSFVTIGKRPSGMHRRMETSSM